MDNHQSALEELNHLVQDLLGRVSRLEREIELLSRSQPVPSQPPGTGTTTTESIRPIPLQPIPLRPISLRPILPANEGKDSVSSSSLESRIGSHWLNRVGIVAVLVGVALFLKYAFEGEWIGATGRVSIGLLAGIAVVIWSERFRVHEYRIFSFSLKALGLGVLYLSLWASFQVYDLIPWIVAFLAMVTVTASTTALALWQEAEILALFALLGGFATPVLLYTGENRQLELFTYIALLNVATLVLTSSRPWRRLLLVSMIATFILYFAWYAAFYRRSELALTLGFATVFFFIFTLAPLVESSFRSDESHDWGVLLFAGSLNALAYFFELYLLLRRVDQTATAMCALALGGLYAFLARFHRPKTPGDTASALRYLHLALSTVFVTLAIAIRFESQWISIGWFIEAAGLMTIGFRLKSSFVRWQALALIAVTIAKVFVYDVWRLERGQRIVSFVVLGVLLLVVSFVYQRNWLRPSLARVVGSGRREDHGD